jgi:hypothetical protein
MRCIIAVTLRLDSRHYKQSRSRLDSGSALREQAGREGIRAAH